MCEIFQSFLKNESTLIEQRRLLKKEKVITSPQRAKIKMDAGQVILNFCDNNNFGLSDCLSLIDAAKRTSGMLKNVRISVFD